MREIMAFAWKGIAQTHKHTSKIHGGAETVVVSGSGGRRKQIAYLKTNRYSN
jgi:hypothetical protein